MLKALGASDEYSAEFLKRTPDKRIAHLTSARPSVPESIWINIRQGIDYIAGRFNMSEKVAEQVYEYCDSAEHRCDLRHEKSFSKEEALKRGWLDR